MIRVLIADDHAIVREGLKRVLETQRDIVVSGEAANRDEVLTKVRNEPFDVVVLDLALGRDNGLEVLKHLHSELPKLPVLILSMQPEEHYAARLLKAGAAGYLSKESAPDQLVGAIMKVSSGGRYVSPAMAERLAFEIGSETSDRPHERLSDREFQVFQMIAAGKGLTEIGHELNVSVKTVSTHRARILAKLAVKNNAELVHYALKQGLIS
ncbi:MAG TPA: response regulator transcription factor [Thermoanaerobaculia bacterium]